MNPYPDENTWWLDFEVAVSNLYQEAGQELNWSAFRWSARTAYDIAAGMSADQSKEKHLVELQAALGLDQPAPPPPGPPPGPGLLPDLTVRGHNFSLATGDYWTAIQCSDFNLLTRYAAGENIVPLLVQRQDCGFNLLRVWTLFDIPNIGTLTACPYDLIPPFVDVCASFSL